MVVVVGGGGGGGGGWEGEGGGRMGSGEATGVPVWGDGGFPIARRAIGE